MTRVIGVVATTLMLAGTAFGQLGFVSDVFNDFVKSAGVPYRNVDSFYVPEGATYVIDYFAQCGGTGTFCNPATSSACRDGVFPGATCPTGFSCQRQNEQYWQCLQAPLTYPTVPQGVQLLEPYGQCGGAPPANSNITVDANGRFVDVACPIGFGCLFFDTDYSLCSPNPLVVPQQSQETPLSPIAQKAFGTQGIALAPGVYQYGFNVPGKVSAPPKPVELTINATKIGEFFDELLGRSPPPPGTPAAPPPGTLPPTPAPAPATPSPFTVPDVTFSPLPPLTIAPVAAPTTTPAGRKLLQPPAVAPGLVTTTTNTPTNLHGFNWFGFNTGDTIVQGLTPNYAETRNFSQVGDFATVVYRQQALGFNAVRLPFRFGDLALRPKPVNQTCTVSTLAQIKANLSDPVGPYSQIDYTNTPFPAQKAPLRNGGVAATGICNGYLPSDTTLNRFLYVIQFYIANGFYVTIDYHGEGSIEVDNLIVSSPNTFAQNWLALLQQIQSLPTYNDYLKGRLFFDLLNEPDGFGFAWSQSRPNPFSGTPGSGTVPAWGNLFTDTAAILIRQEPALLFLVEGTGQANQTGTAYGMGFGINTAIYDDSPGKYNALGGLRYLASNAAVKAATIISPHIYGDSTTGWTLGNGNTNAGNPSLGFTYYNNFAYLSSAGLPLAAGGTTTFPIVVGEFGAVFNSSQSATATNDTFNTIYDDRWIHDFAEFNNNINATTAAAYPHSNIGSTLYWAWNGNQRQALGLVNADPNGGSGIDSQPNYVGPLSPGFFNIQWVKINNLTTTDPRFYSPAAAAATGGGFGLAPWYLQ